MFWGLKITSGNQYDSLVEKSFHVSHAVLEPKGELDVTVEVHIVLHKVDYIVCLLTEKCPQQALNLEISEGEEMTVYVQTSGYLEQCVHLTGFLVMEEERPWEEEGEGEGERDIWDSEDVNEELSDIIFNGEYPSSEEEDDYMIDYPSLSHLEQPAATNGDFLSEEEDKVRPSRKRKVVNKKSEELKKKKAASNKEKEDEVDTLPLKVTKKKKTQKASKNKSDSSVTNGTHQKVVKDTQKVANDTQKVTNEVTSGVKQENCKKTLRCGVDIEELKYGTGKIAKRGSKVTIRYSGHTTGENSVCDTLGMDEKPLGFTIGKKEVMLGLEQGVRGMKVGGCRKIVIPPSLRREGDVPEEVPQDADIILDIQLLSIR